MIKPLYISVLVLLLSSFTIAPQKGGMVNHSFSILTPATPVASKKDPISFSDLSIYGLSQNVFELAAKGFRSLQQKGLIRKNNILTIIDFSKSSSQKRMFVLNVATGKVLLTSLVAHGKNSGLEYATSFSNENESNKSSLGFYTTGAAYMGENGYSLKLNGCERGINDAAYQRAIVIHGADYVSDDMVKAQGFLGRSFGCPAVPQKLSKKIIDIIKNGSCLFIYNPNNKYISHSKLLNA